MAITWYCTPYGGPPHTDWLLGRYPLSLTSPQKLSPRCGVTITLASVGTAMMAGRLPMPHTKAVA
jgi:hypothetical protein